MDNQLKPCPFCGSEAQMTTGFGAFGGRVQIDCTNCRNATWWWEEAVAVRSWNARAALAPSDAVQAPIAWQSGPPPVPEGKCWEFIIAVRRAQSKPPGKVAVFSANYANNFTQDGELSDRDGEEFIANGWYVCGLDMSGEYNEVYETIGLNEGDEIVGWQELPKWSDAAPVAPAAAASEWQPIETVPKDGTEVALLFAADIEILGEIRPRVRAASWRGDWSIPYSRNNPPTHWAHLPAAPQGAAQ